MIDERYSKKEFEKLEQGSSKYLDLQKALQAEIAAELHDVVKLKFRDVSKQLSELGFNFSEQEAEYDGEFSSWSYEYNDPENENSPRIWLTTQTGVMTGYEESSE